MKNPSEEGAQVSPSNGKREVAQPISNGRSARAAAEPTVITLTLKRFYRRYKKSPGKLTDYSNLITQNLTNNPNYTSEEFETIFKSLTDKRAAFVAAWNISKTASSEMNKSATEKAAGDLISALDAMGDYVLANSNNDPLIFKSSGFSEYDERSKTLPIPGAPTNLDYFFEKESGLLFLKCDSLGRDVYYTAWAKEMEGDAWVRVGGSKDSRRIEIDPLTPAKKYNLTISGKRSSGEGPKAAKGVVWVAQ